MAYCVFGDVETRMSRDFGATGSAVSEAQVTQYCDDTAAEINAILAQAGFDMSGGDMTDTAGYLQAVNVVGAVYLVLRALAFGEAFNIDGETVAMAKDDWDRALKRLEKSPSILGNTNGGTAVDTTDSSPNSNSAAAKDAKITSGMTF